MADGLETEATTTKAPKAPTEAAKVKEMASDILDRLSPRFTKLKSCTGVVQDGTWLFTLTGPKIFDGDKVVQTLACEARFPSGINMQKLQLCFYGWCEANANKLGVPKRGRDNDE
jgi:hypothetical protein